MNQPKQKQKKQIILWGKRLSALLTLIIWAVVLYTIFQSGGSFKDQAPQCILSTMLIFGVLTAIYKGLEYWEKA